MNMFCLFFVYLSLVGLMLICSIVGLFCVWWLCCL